MRGFFLILSVAVIALVFASNVAATEEGDCHDEHFKVTIKRGESVTPADHCLQMVCTDEGKIHVNPCMMEVPPNCEVVDGDSSKEWPGCCPTTKCTEE